MKTRRDAKTVDAVVRACKAGATIAEVVKRFAISESTATRILRTERASGLEIALRKGRPPISHRPFHFKHQRPRIDVDPAEVDAALERLRDLDFPYAKRLDAEQTERDVARLRSLPMALVNSTIQPRSSVGVRLCTPFFPNRLCARVGKISTVDAWYNESELRKAIRFQLRHGDPVTPDRVRRALTLLCRTPMIFRPSVAKFVYERYCPPGGIAWDPCAGFGGRLLGAFAAGVHYVATDVDEKTVAGNRELATVCGTAYDIRREPAETFLPPPVDIVFTSPPYFDHEKYSDSDDQSWKKYGANLNAWLNGFLAPVIERARECLRERGHLVLNVANTKSAPNLVQRTGEVATRLGLAHVETLQMPLSAVNRVTPQEPILVFRKT